MVVWSGFRLARQAAAAGIPIAAINQGRTRADGLLQFKLGGDCGEVLGAVAGSPTSARHHQSTHGAGQASPGD